jgi:hypothetical protein
MNTDYSNQTDFASPISAMGFQADPALQLVSQIQSLVSNPAVILPTPGRSPLFQIAEHLAIPAAHVYSKSKPVVTDKVFADIREEALRSKCKKSSHRRGKNGNSFR